MWYKLNNALQGDENPESSVHKFDSERESLRNDRDIVAEKLYNDEAEAEADSSDESFLLRPIKDSLCRGPVTQKMPHFEASDDIKVIKALGIEGFGKLELP